MSEVKTYFIDGRKIQVRPALCLDLDGTIRHSRRDRQSSKPNWISGPDDIVLFPEVEPKIWEYKDNGFLIFGISNQGGVAFGYKTVSDIEAEMEATRNLFDRNPFDLMFAAFSHEKGTVPPFNRRSLLRKPEIGLLAVCEAAAEQEGYIVDWDRSLFVGDSEEDQECARRAGIPFVGADEFFGRNALKE